MGFGGVVCIRYFSMILRHGRLFDHEIAEEVDWNEG